MQIVFEQGLEHLHLNWRALLKVLSTIKFQYTGEKCPIQAESLFRHILLTFVSV